MEKQAAIDVLKRLATVEAPDEEKVGAIQAGIAALAALVPTKVTVWTLAWDLRHEGTGCAVFATEGEAWAQFVEKAASDDEEANRLLEAQDYEELSEYMQDQRENFLDTFEWPSEAEIEVELAKSRVVVVLEGGLVQGILTTVPMDAAVVDYDTDGADDDEVFSMPQGDGTTVDACGSIDRSALNPARAIEMYEAVEAAK